MNLLRGRSDGGARRTAGRSRSTPARDPVDVVDNALALVVGRRQLARAQARALSVLLTDAVCAETVVPIVELGFWAETLPEHTTPAAPVVDALLDIRLALTKRGRDVEIAT